MPKRKRDPRDTGASGPDPTQEVEARIHQSKKLLNKALKLARNFERQKLDKRLKLTEKEDSTEETRQKKDRLLKEAETLKALDISKVVDVYLYKTLLRTKTIAQSNLLPEWVVVEKNGLEGEDALAYENVTARMLNTKPVKETMVQIMQLLYVAAGLPDPAQKKQKKDTKKEVLIKPTIEDIEEHTSSHGGSEIDEDILISKLKAARTESVNGEPEWEGFGSDSDEEADSELDDDGGLDLADFEARIVGSSDEDSDDGYDSADFTLSTASAKPNAKIKTLNPRDLSITPSPPRSRDPSPSVSLSDAEDDEDITPPQLKKESRIETKPKIAPPPPTKSSSQFLPTLMGGYWSGDSEASDIEDKTPAIKAPRKNRRGQIERRKIAELKFGSAAKHIVAGKVPSKDMGRATRETAAKGGAKRGKGSGDARDAGWDAQRGATGGGRRGFARSKELVTGENAAPLGNRAAESKHRDDKGSLHPSWEAAKKAKEEKKAAVFVGKKVVFD